MGKKYVKTVYCHPAYLTYMQSTSWETLGWMKHKLESGLLGEISITSVPSSRGPSWPRNWTPISYISCIAGRFFTHWTTWEALADKGPSSQSCGFSSSHVRMWELDHKEGWVPKNYAFKLWCWRRLLRVSWTAGRLNQPILKEYSLEGLMLKLKLQYFGHLIQRADSFEKTLMLGKIEGRRRRGWQRMRRRLDGITDSGLRLSKLWEM